MWPFTKRFTPWTLYAENQVLVKEEYNPVWGMGIIRKKVLVDIFVRTSKRTGFPQYRYVEKPFITMK